MFTLILLDDFIFWIGEKLKPTFGLIAGFGDEDKIGAIVHGGLDSDTPQDNIIIGFLLWI